MAGLFCVHQKLAKLYQDLSRLTGYIADDLPESCPVNSCDTSNSSSNQGRFYAPTFIKRHK